MMCLLSLAAEQQVAERCGVIYGDVIDKAARKNVSICGRAEQDGGLSRVYVSQSNLLHIVFTPATSPHQQQQRNFIIHVEGNVNVDRLQVTGAAVLLSVYQKITMEVNYDILAMV